jgi:LDH2 family malate/lactate/ureidoglycolate dehydrogenase
VDEILIPGERSARAAENNEHEGIPLGAETITEIQKWCAHFEVAFDLAGSEV